MSYNIRNGRGSDKNIDLERIAAVIESFDPDVVALQEVDVCGRRSGGADQAVELADRLGMEVRFAPCVTLDADGHMGIATLSRWPIGGHRIVELPRRESARRSEPRCALFVDVERPDGERLELINTHLSVLRRERPAQVAHLVDSLGRGDLIVAGDLNCSRRSRSFQALADLECAVPSARTWPARLPVLQLDHMLFRGALEVRCGGAWRGAGARAASDHLPVVASFTFTPDRSP